MWWRHSPVLSLPSPNKFLELAVKTDTERDVKRDVKVF